MNKMRDAARNILEHVVDEVETKIEEGLKEVDAAVKQRLDTIITTVKETAQQATNRFAGVRDAEMLTFVPDRRSFSWVGPLFLAFFCLAMLPGSLKFISLAVFMASVFFFIASYLLKAKVDVAEGFEGVICRYGAPQGGQQSKRGRNWLLNFGTFIPYIVSKRDLVVDMTAANFTSDFASLATGMQLVVRIVDAPKFVRMTTPKGIMKILAVYANYICVRMITSMDDVRVKFTGRDRLQNVIDALNSYLEQPFGVRVVAASMPTTTNSVLDDLEEIRTQLKAIDALQETKQMKKETAVKEVENAIRTSQRQSRNEALTLQQAKIKLETKIGEEINRERQELLMQLRQRLEQRLSALKKDVADFSARLQKLQVLREQFVALETDLKIREAAIKRQLMQRMIPRQIQVFGLDGIGTGVGLSMGSDMLRHMLRPSNNVHQPEAEQHTS